jgi:Transposase, Mutator family/Transposase IS116/IS110/IS902 family
LRNLLAHVPQGDKVMVAAAVRTIFAQPNRPAAGQQVQEVVKALEGRWPKAAKVLADAKDDILAYMAFPSEHWTRLSSSNPLERLNREVKRRTDIVGVFPDQDSVIRLVGSVLLEADDEWQIERLFLTHPDAELFVSLPGAGKRLAPRLLAEWGDDRTRYQEASSGQALAGTSPVAFQSGNVARAHRRYACNKVLRNAFHQFAWQSTRFEPWALAYYQRKRQEGKTHTIAVRALANHWVLILFAAWTTRRPYDRAIFEAAQQAHAPRAA